jgi:hypothetical protein
MDPKARQTELEQREQELRQRELELRIRELEGELHLRGGSTPASNAPEPPISPTRPLKARKTRWSLWKGKLWVGLQFFMIVVGVIAAIRVANWFGMLLIVGMISWVLYKVFFEVDD